MRSAYPFGGYVAPGGGYDYDYSAYPVTHIVDPAGTTAGTGSELNPLTVAQAIDLATTSSYVHCEWLPGADPVALLNAKWPAVRPSNSGSATRPIIHRARNPAISTPNQADRTRFIRASGEGSFFGVGVDGQVFSDIIWDGFECLDYCNQNYGDRFGFSVWDGTRIALRRSIIENGGGALGSGDNHGCVWGQAVNGFEIGDCLIGNNTYGENAENAAAILFYDVNNVDIHHCEIYQSDALVWFKGLHDGQTMRNNSVRLSVFRDAFKLGVGYSAPDGGTTHDDLLRIYQNHIHSCQSGVWTNSYGPGSPQGVALINNLIRACTSGVLLKPGAGGYAPTLTNRNNIFFQNTYAIESQDTSWAASHSMFEFDYNNYYGHTAIYRESGTSRDWAYWTGTIGNEANGINVDPSFVDANSGDYRLNGGSSVLNAGFDYLQLLGGLQSAAINLGPYVSAGQDETIGVRAA
jgi:hypothetical protein